MDTTINDLFNIPNSKVHRITISEPVLSAISLLSDEKIDALLVTEREKVVGIVSGREIATSLVSNPLEKIVKTPVGNIMSTNFSISDKNTLVSDLIQILQKYRQGISFIGEKSNVIGSVTFNDLLELYNKTNSSALISDLHLHEIISTKSYFTIKSTILLMLKNNIRRIFVAPDMSYVTERDIFSTIYESVLKKDFSVLNKPTRHCPNKRPILIGNESIKYICDLLNKSDGTCITVDKKYVITKLDIVNSFLIESIHEFRHKLVESEKLTLIGTLTTRLAHDIRNPLSIIQVALENLKLKYGTYGSSEQSFDKITRSIDRITHQIDDVLHFVKGQPIKISKVKSSEIINDSLDSIIVPENIKLTLPKNDVELFCDKEQCVIVMNNLILNAIQAIDGTGTIEISLEENKDEIAIQVKDSGQGIPKENLDKIFEPLFTTKQTGTGLGLVSVKSIIESHGGTISVTSPPTVFTITLPKISN